MQARGKKKGKKSGARCDEIRDQSVTRDDRDAKFEGRVLLVEPPHPRSQRLAAKIQRDVLLDGVDFGDCACSFEVKVPQPDLQHLSLAQMRRKDSGVCRWRLLTV